MGMGGRGGVPFHLAYLRSGSVAALSSLASAKYGTLAPSLLVLVPFTWVQFYRVTDGKSELMEE